MELLKGVTESTPRERIQRFVLVATDQLMRVETVVRFAALVIVALVAAACGGGASTAIDPTDSPTTVTSPNAAALSWTVTEKSKATARVREQLVGVNVPSDAILSATGAKGSFALNSDGTFASGSKITFDLATLTSDNFGRDNFVKQDTLATQTYPTATFVPSKVAGLTLPLPASGDFTFTLNGTLTIHGKDKPVTFEVKATRTGAELVATATVTPALKFGDFGMSAPSVPFRVVSVTDEIRLVVELVATGPAS